MLDIHDSETFQDNIAIANDFTFLFSSEKQQPTGRPVADLVKFLGYLIGGNDPGFFHLLVVAFHSLASILLAQLAWRLGMGLPASLIGGSLFLVNVAHFQAVHHISALDYPLALSLGFGALLSYNRYLTTGGFRWLLGFYAGSLLSILALVAMAFLLPLCFYWSLVRGSGFKSTLRHLLPLLGLAGLEIFFIISITPEETNTGRTVGFFFQGDIPSYLVGMGRLFLWALSRLLTTAHWLPFPLYEFHYWELFVGAGALGFLFFLVYRRHFFESFWSVWILLSLLPFLPITETGNLDRPSGPSRYLYLATAGSSLLLAWWIREVANKLRLKGWRTYLLHTAILSALFTSSYFFLKQAEAISLYSSGRYYIFRGDRETGIHQLKRAILKGPGTIDLHDAYLRLCLAEMGNGKAKPVLEEGLGVFPGSFSLNIYKLVDDSFDSDHLISNAAIATLDEFKTFPLDIELNGMESGRINFDTPNSGALNLFIGSAFHNIGLGFESSEDFDRAIPAYRLALEFDPEKNKSYQNLIRSLHGAGQVGAAAQTALQALQNIPRPPNGLLVNASLALAASGDLEKAIALGNKILVNDPTDSQIKAVLFLHRRILKADSGFLDSSTWTEMGANLLDGGWTADSITAFRKALERDQANAPAQFGLALAFLTQGEVEKADTLFSNGVARLGRAAAEETGAQEKIRDLISRGIHVEGSRKILSSYFPHEGKE